MLEAIERRLKMRVWAANSVINGIRERLDGTGALFAWPPKFTFPHDMDLANPLLSRLAFLVRYESVLGSLEAASRRARPEEQRLADGDTLRLRSLGDGWFALDTDQHGLELVVDDWPHYLLTRDDDAGRRARQAFNDFRWRQAMWPPKHLPAAYTAITAVDTSRQRLQLEVNGHKDAWAPVQPGEWFHLDTRFVDITSRRLLTEIVAESQDGGHRFSDLLRSPSTARRALPEDFITAKARALAAPHMTPTQRDAFDAILHGDTTLVWGPPGTGKTHFLALAILALAAAHQHHGRSLHTAVVGFTHTAIDNLLGKINELRPLLPAAADIRKIAAPPPVGAARLEPAHLAGHLATTPIVIHGSTIWQLAKVPAADVAYDLLVIDEGSQLKVAEALPAVRRTKPGGRLVIAGDHLQLPPIYSGRYPPQPSGEPEVATSILEALQQRPGADSLTSTLLENFRMCDVLCGYPASTIYPANYRPYDDRIAHRRLNMNRPLASGRTVDAVTELALDPNRPLVVGVLDGVTATAHNPVEASVVADIAETLRQRVDGDDQTFWRDRLFIVSPHHVQIRAIRRELAQRHEWQCAPFVDTVDKMQGQEADCVVISYGVADVETALRENEFIYSLNRMNVSITRGRAKTIVLLSRQLLDPPVTVLDDPATADGVAFIQGLADWAETGESTLVQLGDTVRLALLRR
jgi:hypothetical protein